MSTTTALATVERTGRAMIAAEALQEETAQRGLLGQYVAHHMAEGTDYGVIPGTKNKTLLKPGAEKLTQLFRCIPRYVIEEKIENWDTGLFYYRFSCQVVTQADGLVVAEGVGSCSTYESRYRYRNQDRACPVCKAAAIKRSKYPPRDEPDAEPGWYCHAKAGGCGANFPADDPGITEQRTGRVENPDLHDCANTVLKMAKKRALVDAAIALARCSDIFTQDLEDLAAEQPAPAEAQPPPAPPSKDELRAMLKRKNWGWAAAVKKINEAEKAAYDDMAAPEQIDARHLFRFCKWLEKERDVNPPDQQQAASPPPPASPPASPPPVTAPGIAGPSADEVAEFSQLCNQKGQTWANAMEWLSAATNSKQYHARTRASEIGRHSWDRLVAAVRSMPDQQPQGG